MPDGIGHVSAAAPIACTRALTEMAGTRFANGLHLHSP